MYATGERTAGVRLDGGALALASNDLDWSEDGLLGDFVCPTFKIRAADSSGERSSASVLIQRMYAWRGYDCAPLPQQAQQHSITLVASDHEATIGTLTVGFDTANGLLADDLFGDEIDALRRQGRQVCEFTKLAIDAENQSKPVLAALFNVAYIYAHRIRGVDTLLIEVNPRHARYYAAMLGFTVIGPKRMNRRVNAPAVLLAVDFEQVRDGIAKFGGRQDLAHTERSLYPYSFSPREEEGIVARLLERFPRGGSDGFSAARRPSTAAVRRLPASYSPSVRLS